MAQLYMQTSRFASQGRVNRKTGSILFYSCRLNGPGTRETMMTEARQMELDGLQVAVLVKNGEWSNQTTVLGDAKSICANPGELYYRNTKFMNPCRFFLDLDPCLPIDSSKCELAPLQLLYDKYLAGLVSRVNSLLEKHLGSISGRVYVDRGVRLVHKNQDLKYSAHLVWPDIVFPTTANVKQFVANVLPTLLSDDKWGSTGHFRTFMGCTESSDDEVVWDAVVYNDTRLLRGPLQPKLKDRATILELGVYNGHPIGHITNSDVSKADLSSVWDERNPFCWGLKANAVYEEPANPSPPSSSSSSAPSPLAFDDQEGVLLATGFPAIYDMLKNVFWPNMMERRREHAQRQFSSADLVTTTAVSTILSPSLICTVKNKQVWTESFTVPGDDMCLCDPRGHHRQNPNGKTSFQINLSSFTVQQNCWVCGIEKAKTHALAKPSGKVPRTLIRPAERQGLYDTIVRSRGRSFPRFFVASIQHDMVHRPTSMDGGQNFFIYCDKPNYPIWACESEVVTNILTDRLDDFIDQLAVDITVIKRHGKDDDDDDDTTEIQFDAAFAKVVEHGNKFKSINPEVPVRAHVERWSNSDKEMDVCPHLVSLCDTNAFDILTGTIRPIQRDDYITATTKSKLLLRRDGKLDLDHPECMEISRWFLDIAAGRPDLALYLKRLCGYSFTHMVFDRKCYVLYGHGSDGKSTLGKFFQECLGSERYFSVPPSFFGDAQNKNTGAEAATANAAQFYRKTCCMTEDMSSGVIQSAKIKSYSAGDRISGRQLYKNVSSWKQTAKLWFATNVDPRFSTLDQAIIDRVVVVPMDSRWVRNPNPNLGEKQADNVYLDRLMTYKDAFTTVVLHEISTFLQSVHGQQDRFIPIPECVRVRTNSYIMDNHPYKRFIMECLDVRKVLNNNGTCCLGVMPMFAAYKSYQSHVQAKGDKASATDTEAEFAKQMKLCGINVCGINQKYPYYHKPSAREYCGEFHTVAPMEQIMSSHYQSVQPSTSSSSFSPNKRHCGQFITADASV